MALTINGTTGIETNTDTGKLKFGAGDDLEIYHNGSHGYIKNTGDGNLYIEDAGIIRINTDSFAVQNNDGSQSIITAAAGGGVDLYHNNVKKLRTASDGIQVEANVEGGEALCTFVADEADDNNDYWAAGAGNGKFTLKTYGSGAWTERFRFEASGNARFLAPDGGLRYFFGEMGNSDSAQLSFYDSSDSQKVRISAHSTDTTFFNNGSGVNIGGTTQTFADTKLVVGDGSAANQGMTIYCGSSNVGLLNFADGASSGDRYRGFLQYDHSNNSLNIGADNTRVMQIYSTSADFFKDILPNSDDSRNVGSSSKRFDNIYASNGTIQTSDKNEKNTITTSDLGLSFITDLKPVSFKFNGKTRTHYGLISQDVETLLDGKDFAGFIKEDNRYGLRYSEFIAPLIKAIQELSTEVETLKTKVAALEAA